MLLPPMLRLRKRRTILKTVVVRAARIPMTAWHLDTPLSWKELPWRTWRAVAKVMSAGICWVWLGVQNYTRTAEIQAAVVMQLIR